MNRQRIQTFIWEVFLSHASEDKDHVARPLANLLAGHGLKVWLDEGELHLGDSLREKIDFGLSNSKFVAVVLSPSFFSKKWPKLELDSVFASDSDEVRILPIWHNIGVEEIQQNSPLIAARVGISTDKGLKAVSDSISRSILKSIDGGRIDCPIFYGPLTKRILMAIPEGSILTDNSVNPVDLTPLFETEVGPVETREDLWKLLKSKHRAGRICYIYRDWASYRANLSARSIWTGRYHEFK
jgi:TIR domain-containing protein